MFIITIIWSFLCLLAAPAAGFTAPDNFQKPFYVGVSGGLGSTTWRGLVPAAEKQNSAISLSTPIEVKEGGGVWGIFTGYEFTPNFAIEANYRHYHRAKVIFNEDSIFAFEHDGRLIFNTDTKSIDIMAKVMLVIPKTPLRLYSSIGMAEIHRQDEISQHKQISPTFGGGFNFSFTKHFMAELGFNYTAGYGESELNPADDYMPFLYSGFFSLAYRF